MYWYSLSFQLRTNRFVIFLHHAYLWHSMRCCISIVALYLGSTIYQSICSLFVFIQEIKPVKVLSYIDSISKCAGWIWCGCHVTMSCDYVFSLKFTCAAQPPSVW